MTRKDYVRFAAMLKSENVMSVRHDWTRTHTIDSVIESTADIFAADNPNFNRARFLKACGVES